MSGELARLREENAELRRALSEAWKRGGHLTAKQVTFLKRVASGDRDVSEAAYGINRTIRSLEHRGLVGLCGDGVSVKLTIAGRQILERYK